HAADARLHLSALHDALPICRHRFEVTERLAADGSVLVPLDPASVERALEDALAGGAEALAVCFLHSYLNPAHERAVADAAKGRQDRKSTRLHSSHEWISYAV